MDTTEMITSLAPRPTALSSGAPPRRILIGKVGLDGHDRGAKYVAQVLRDAGYEAIYTGIRRTPEEIVAAAVQENVDAIGLSLLSGAHLVLVARVRELLEAANAADIPLFLGGTIPDEDLPWLRELGVSLVFTPGATARDITDAIGAALGAPVEK